MTFFHKKISEYRFFSVISSDHLIIALTVIPLNSKSLSDKELLTRYRKTGNRKYLAIVFERYMHLVYGLCLKYLKSREDSQDAVMDIFERLTDILRNEEVNYFKSWLYTVSKNHCLVQLRRHKEIVSMDENFMELDHYDHPNGEADELEQNLKKLEKCIETLKDEQKKCISMFFLQKKSYAVISSSTKLKLNEVKSFIQNGKRNLKICMENNR